MTSRIPQARGFSMIEVLVTLILLSIGLVGLAQLQSTTVKGSFDSSQRSQAAWVAQELVERMRGNPDGLASGYTTAAQDANLCADGPAKLCADHFDGTAKVAADATCSADEVAEYDVWELTCGFALAGTSSAAAQIALAADAFSLTCEDADTTDTDPCSAGSDFTATINWTATAADISSGEEAAIKSIAFNVRP